jgi:hypothetical protein
VIARAMMSNDVFLVHNQRWSTEILSPRYIMLKLNMTMKKLFNPFRRGKVDKIIISSLDVSILHKIALSK